MSTVSQALASFVSAIDAERMSDSVERKASELLVDTIGCSVGAFTSPPVKALRDAYLESSGTQNATVVGTAQRAALPEAALINGTMGRYLDYNDTYMSLSTACHPSDHIMPLLSVAEVEGATGGDLLEAIVAAYEVEARGLDEAPVDPNGFDYVTWGVYSSVAAVGRLMRLTETELVDAIGIAGASNNPLYVSRRGDVSMWKGIAHSYATHNAIKACQMARNGITGPTAVFEEDDGFFEAIAESEVSFETTPDHDALRILQTNIKPYACGYYIAAPVAALREIMTEHGLEADDIDHITVEIFETAADLLATPDKWDTDLNRETADHSIPYTIAVAAIDGDVGPEQYADDRLRDSTVHNLMQRIDVHANEELTAYRSREPSHIPSVVTVTSDGAEYRTRIDCPLGHAENPMSTDQLEAKMRTLCEGYLSDQQIQTCLDRCWSFTDLETVAPLIEDLRI